VLLRCTGRLRKLLGNPPLAEAEAAQTDWYVNLLWTDGRKCLLATHAGTLFSVFAPDVRVAQLRPLGGFLAPLIVAQLMAERFDVDALGALGGEQTVIAKTADRSVLGSMNDLAALCELYAADAGGLARLDVANLHDRLHRQLCSTLGFATPIEMATDWAHRTAVGRKVDR
jgi:hypothetical protein